MRGRRCCGLWLAEGVACRPWVWRPLIGLGLGCIGFRVLGEIGGLVCRGPSGLMVDG
jgi:hypothetical protein